MNIAAALGSIGQALSEAGEYQEKLKYNYAFEQMQMDFAVAKEYKLQSIAEEFGNRAAARDHANRLETLKTEYDFADRNGSRTFNRKMLDEGRTDDGQDFRDTPYGSLSKQAAEFSASKGDYNQKVMALKNLDDRLEEMEKGTKEYERLSGLRNMLTAELAGQKFDFKLDPEKIKQGLLSRQQGQSGQTPQTKAAPTAPASAPPPIPNQPNPLMGQGGPRPTPPPSAPPPQASPPQGGNPINNAFVGENGVLRGISNWIDSGMGFR